MSRIDNPFEESPNSIESEFVVEVQFTGFTDDGLIRHGIFRGIREDEKPLEVKLEVPRQVPDPGVITNAKSRWRRPARR
jgi:bifunctional non-homologous end joining protein LigD